AAPAEPATAEPAEPATAAPHEPAAGQPAGDRRDDEAARLVALDLALSGRSREEVDRHLAEHYDLADRNSVLESVFSTIEG
ncbi:MAG TPA: hypothetical protein VLB47_07445, partial [Solirubrobacteraceae bacterium]|nr:hypothetical protein [Solirubrobacteraceae bacterium]